MVELSIPNNHIFWYLFFGVRLRANSPRRIGCEAEKGRRAWNYREALNFCGSLFLGIGDFMICGNKFLRLEQLGFSCLELIFAIFRTYPQPSIDSFLLSTVLAIEIHIFKQYYRVHTLCKTSDSLYTVLFLKERDNL